VDENKSAEGAEWLAKIEEENADDLTPERLAALEAANADGAENGNGNGDVKPAMGVGAGYKRVRLDEDRSPTAGRRFTRS
jgi:(E)-4-hydroxy-3-methylbut-2-enyl-diphosphate synthase